MTPEAPPRREAWGSRLGFVLAAAGSAIGLGNLWGFSYKASLHGGAAFVLVYLAVIALIGVPLLVAELVIGRRTGESPVMALYLIGGRRWRLVGYLFAINAVFILSFYSVVTGWTLLSLGRTLLRGLPADPAGFFSGINEGWTALWGHLLAMALTAMVIAAGVRRGIERLSLWMIPLLMVLLVALAIWAGNLGEASEGYRFFLQPDFSQLMRWPTITAAAGHAFFSLSVGIGAIITYASYLRGKSDLVKLSGLLAGADTAVALLGGLITFPLMAHFRLLDRLSDSAIGTLFIAIPTGMASLGQAGRVLAAFFFLVLAIAALTSAVSLLEVSTAGLIDRLGWSRRRSTGVAALVVTLLGVLPSFNNVWIDVEYSLFGESGLLLGGLLTAILLGWSHPALAREELGAGFAHPRAIRWWIHLLRYVATPMLGFLLLQSAIQLPRVLAPLLAS